MNLPSLTKSHFCFALGAVAIALTPSVHGAINFGVDWESYAQSISGTDTSFTLTDVDGSGIDLVVSLSGPGNTLFLTTTQYPVNMGDNPLNWTTDFASNLDTATLSFEFFKTGTSDEAFITGLAFDIYDVDRQSGGSPFSYVDVISGITGFNGASAIAPVSVNGTSIHSITGSGSGAVVEGLAKNGNTNPNGTVAVDFGANVLSKFAFTVSNNAPITALNPGLARLGIGDIENLTAIPEPGHYAAIMAALLAGIGIYFRKRSA